MASQILIAINREILKKTREITGFLKSFLIK
jgi:hypothetical protein